MDLIQIAQEIYNKTREIDKVRKIFKERALARGSALVEYRKEFAKKIIQLRNGKSFELDGETVNGKGLQAILIKDIAKGICWEERLHYEESEALYWSARTNLEALQNALSGLQSINKYLDEK